MPRINRNKEAKLTLAMLKSRLLYIPDTGAFYWRDRCGKRAGNLNAKGLRYLHISINKTSYLAHRLAFFYVTGKWPVNNVDHLNSNPLDNRWINLKDHPQSENVARARGRLGASGIRGVSFKKGKWEAAIKVRGQSYHLGRFDTDLAAGDAYRQACVRFGRGHLSDPGPPPPLASAPSTLATAIQPKAERTPITADEVREALTYNAETGTFIWRNNRNWRTAAGDIAGGIMKPWGHRSIKIHSKGYLAHRLAWLYVTGEWPIGQVDHINGVPDDNRWCNLRLVTASQNMTNRKLFNNNRLGVKGVFRVGNRYMACIQIAGVQRRLGRFDTVEEAVAAYKRAAAELHGEFARAA